MRAALRTAAAAVARGRARRREPTTAQQRLASHRQRQDDHRPGLAFGSSTRRRRPPRRPGRYPAGRTSLASLCVLPGSGQDVELVAGVFECLSRTPVRGGGRPDAVGGWRGGCCAVVGSRRRAPAQRHRSGGHTKRCSHIGGSRFRSSPEEGYACRSCSSAWDAPVRAGVPACSSGDVPRTSRRGDPGRPARRDRRPESAQRAVTRAVLAARVQDHADDPHGGDAGTSALPSRARRGGTLDGRSTLRRADRGCVSDVPDTVCNGIALQR